MKATFNNTTKSFILENGVVVPNSTLAAGVKGVLKKDTGNFEVPGNIKLNDCIVNDDTLNTFDNGVFTSVLGAYTQANGHVEMVEGAGKDSDYAYYIHRYPNISSTSTWCGVRLQPPSADMRVHGNSWRLSFDYRGYSGGNGINVYQCTNIGWSTLGVGLPSPWNTYTPAIDSWKWKRFTKEFNMDSNLIDWVPGANLAAWSPTTTYNNALWVAVTYNGNVYRHRPNTVQPTLGVAPNLESGGGTAWDTIYPQTAGYFNVYAQIKIGFTYQTQNTRGTHVYVDNIHLTNITTNKTYRFNLQTNEWEFEKIETGKLFEVVGSGYIGVARTDGGGDVFGTHGSRELIINDVSINSASSRGLRLHIFDESDVTTEIFNGTYDIYGDDASRNTLASKLATISSTQIWTLSSYDAIGINATLSAQMLAMGSRLLRTIGEDKSVFTAVAQRSTYACVGKGQTIIKEDGSNSSDSKYRRAASVKVRV